jgi:hypothetical protein
MISRRTQGRDGGLSENGEWQATLSRLTLGDGTGQAGSVPRTHADVVMQSLRGPRLRKLPAPALVDFALATVDIVL